MLRRLRHMLAMDYFKHLRRQCSGNPPITTSAALQQLKKVASVQTRPSSWQYLRSEFAYIFHAKLVDSWAAEKCNPSIPHHPSAWRWQSGTFLPLHHTLRATCPGRHGNWSSVPKGSPSGSPGSDGAGPIVTILSATLAIENQWKTHPSQSSHSIEADSHRTRKVVILKARHVWNHKLVMLMIYQSHSRWFHPIVTNKSSQAKISQPQASYYPW